MTQPEDFNQYFMLQGGYFDYIVSLQIKTLVALSRGQILTDVLSSMQSLTIVFEEEHLKWNCCMLSYLCEKGVISNIIPSSHCMLAPQHFDTSFNISHIHASFIHIGL